VRLHAWESRARMCPDAHPNTRACTVLCRAV